ncbi:hypothetical protein QP411_03655 [Pseudoglutamicibacter cumminsii]|uniref:hypothetical protein n=1 Tax=Pseudoglutamicibacter cumminsii TaxID=156979 RepID=UPI00255738A2|nr:hypothetical protein [Pseudoglutamicibacter cumminsii]MDK7083011.1 hypothetical protein [Pseudoglutamicibacter cumminsii]
MPNCWVEWPAPVPNVAMYARYRTVQFRAEGLKAMRRGAESVALPAHHLDWDAIARVEPTPQKVRDLLAQGPRPGVAAR